MGGEVIKLGTGTKKTLYDGSRPKAMLDADKIFNKLFQINGGTAADALGMMDQISSILNDTKATNIEKLWDRLSKGVNKNRPIKIQATTEAGKLQTALGLFYPALESLDRGDSISLVASLRQMYLEARNYIENRFINKQEGVEKRVSKRVISTLDTRFEQVIKRFNQRVADGEIVGQEIQL